VSIYSSLIRRVARHALALAPVFALACDQFKAERQRSQSGGYVETDSMGAEVRDVKTVRFSAGKWLSESSGAAMSPTQPGVFYTIEDSGNDPKLTAADTTGTVIGTWRLRGTKNQDWEAVATGMCGFDRAAPTCVYIGDTGDNESKRAARAIYRIPERSLDPKDNDVKPERLEYSYPDWRHDVESMYVAQNGDVVLITKRPLTDGGARLRAALVYVIPADAWTKNERATAQLVDSLPIVPGSAPLRMVTDAAFSPDGKHLAVRTYAQAYIFATNAQTGRVDHSVKPAVCNIVPLGEPQGEGITWANAKGRLLFTSEGRNAPVKIGTCPMP
jgi:hypothetical protein